jgi:hypothetical protein
MTTRRTRESISESLNSREKLKDLFSAKDECFEENETEDMENELMEEDDYGEDNDSDIEEDDDLDDSDDLQELEDPDDDADSGEASEESEDGDEVGHSGDDEEAEEDDLLTLKDTKRTPRLGKGHYTARIGRITAALRTGEGGDTWVVATVPFEIPGKTGKPVTVFFKASTNLNPNGRMYPLVTGILGYEPEAGYSLRNLQGRQVRVEIDHRQDPNGNVWEEVISAKKFG